MRIFSASNPAFKVKLESSGLLSKYSNSNTNKNAKIKRLEAEVALLRQKSKLITNGLADNIAALGTKSALINAEIASLTGNPPTGFGTNQLSAQPVKSQYLSTSLSQGQPQYPINPGLSQLDQPQIQPTGFRTDPGLAQQFLSNSLSQSQVLQSQQIQPPSATLEKKVLVID